ncbi:MAG: helix-turn-helix transcriptional regulator [Candidatus Limnocylindrales bacterium]
MPVNRKALSEAERGLRHQSTRAADELRALRLRAGLSQAAVAREVGVARSVVTRLGAGDPGITLRTRFRIATVLGADLRLTAYAESGPLIRDTAQSAIVEHLLGVTDPLWRPRIEAPIPGPGRRSVDLLLQGPRDVVLIEVETHVSSLEEIIRELHAKRQALIAAHRTPGTEPEEPRVHVVLALPPTRHHRAIIAAHPRMIAAAFPVSSSSLEDALRRPTEPWPGDGILWVRRRQAS